jgi:hypothetical protein
MYSPPRVHHVGSDDCLIEPRCGLQPAGQLVGEQDVGELGLVVGHGTGVVPLTLKVGEVDAPLSMRVGRNRDHSGRRAVRQPVEEQVGKEERRKVVKGEGAFEAVGSARAGATGAVAVADSGGIGSLTIRSLAQHLGAKPMSLYYYVTGKDEILDGIVDLVFSEIELPSVGGDWRAEIVRRANSARRALRRQSWAIGLMESRKIPAPRRCHTTTPSSAPSGEPASRWR